MKRSSIARIIPGLLAAFALAACSTTSETVPRSPPTPQPESEFSQPAVPEPVTGSGLDVSSRLQTIYFDFDRSEIRGDARPILRANAEVLRTSGAHIVIAGHCDQRGSEEYNSALGESRAHSVMKYLGNLGVSSSQMSIVSYGETRPAVAGYTEAAFSLNRRVEFQAP